MSPRSVRAVVTLVVVGLALAGLLPEDAGASGGKVYWIDSPCWDTIAFERANLDGTRVEMLALYEDCVQGFALDVAGRKMYWTDSTDMVIARANLDGSGLETVMDTWPSEPSGIALDAAGGKMYWAESYWPDGKIRRADLDGTGVEDLVAGLRPIPWGIALDVAGGKMYWTAPQYLGEGKIQRANLDGTEVEDLVTGVEAYGIALDVANAKIYWTAFPGPIQRANLDGTGVENVLPGAQASGIALDVPGGKMYWDFLDEYPLSKIQRANLDGTGVEDLVRELNFPSFIALDLTVGGSVTGFQPAKVACRNITTGQRLKITPPPGAQSWDCQGAGLGVDSGDGLRMSVRGPALDPPIAGSAINSEPSRVICRNFTTGQRVEIVLPPGAESWDCTAAGLVASPGDVVKMRVRGSVP